MCVQGASSSSSSSSSPRTPSPPPVSLPAKGAGLHVKSRLPRSDFPLKSVLRFQAKKQTKKCRSISTWGGCHFFLPGTPRHPLIRVLVRIAAIQTHACVLDSGQCKGQVYVEVANRHTGLYPEGMRADRPAPSAKSPSSQLTRLLKIHRQMKKQEKDLCFLLFSSPPLCFHSLLSSTASLRLLHTAEMVCSCYKKVSLLSALLPPSLAHSPTRLPLTPPNSVTRLLSLIRSLALSLSLSLSPVFLFESSTVCSASCLSIKRQEVLQSCPFPLSPPKINK